MSLELGGKSPSIVYPDAGEDRVVDGVIAGMRFTRQSQSCTAGSRLFLHADIFDDLLDRLRAKTQALTVGDPLDETTDIGAIIFDERRCGRVSPSERGRMLWRLAELIERDLEELAELGGRWPIRAASPRWRPLSATRCRWAPA